MKANIYYAKGLGKTAFTVAFGLVMGKYVGELTKSVSDGVLESLLSNLAKRGNEVAKKTCDVNGIKYGSDHN